MLIGTSGGYKYQHKHFAEDVWAARLSHETPTDETCPACISGERRRRRVNMVLAPDGRW